MNMLDLALEVILKNKISRNHFNRLLNNMILNKKGKL